MLHNNALNMFQFHYGTIKRKTSRVCFCCTFLFQFHYGTIKSTKAKASKRKYEEVSIPLWYD